MDRESIDHKYTWDLTPMFASDEVFETELKKIMEDIEGLAKYKGRLGESPDVLLEYVKAKDEVERKSSKLFTYSAFKSDLNTKDGKYQDMKSRTTSMTAKIGEVTSFDLPEIMALDEKKLQSYLEREEFALYRHTFENILRNKPHVLNEEQERLLALSAEMAGGAQNAFTLLTNADMVFEDALDSEGKPHEVNSSSYGLLQLSKDRELRKNAFINMHKGYKEHINTLASLLETEVKKNIFYAKARGFHSAREAALFENNVPVSVQDKLIESLHKNMKTVHKVLELRKQALGYDQLHLYDNYVSLVDYDEKVPYEEAKETVKKAVEPMGKDYVETVTRGFEQRWVDVYPSDGKKSGAYSWGTYDTNPYMLLNYTDTMNNMFTLIHEFGHSMHSYLSNQNQEHVNSHYSIFVAEIASTTNEALLNHYLMEHEKDPVKREAILVDFIDRFRATVFRQGMFAEFERDIHAHVEKGGSLTADFMCNHYLKLVKEYFGDSVYVDEEIQYEWARIPHFYYNFYVYQYATGMSAAIALSDDIIKNGPERALAFLSAGGSDYPINVMKKAGIDMESGETVDKALQVLNGLVSDYEKILNGKKK